jgi:pimeloyl-ACP methyl ester carboxylesterase
MTYVLIPGAWHGGWAWQPVARRLRAAGHDAVTLTLPGLGDGDDPAGWRLRDAAEHVVKEVTGRNLTDVTLVGHSWGGYPLHGALDQLAARVSRVVYYGAQVPVEGRSMVDDNPPENAAMLRSLIDASSTRSIAPALAYVQIFMQGVPLELQQVVADLLTDFPGDYALDPATGAGPLALGIPATYIISVDDQALPRSGVEFAARAGVQPIAVPGTHLGLLTHPDEVAQAILAAREQGPAALERQPPE